MFVDHLLLWLHIGFAIFTIGPLTVATMSTPRFVRNGDAGVVGYLHRSTRLYGLLSVLVFLVGAGMAGSGGGFDRAWLSISMALFIVGVALVFAVIEPAQRQALDRLRGTADAPAPAGRIGAIAGIVSLIWLAILVLMIWQP